MRRIIRTSAIVSMVLISASVPGGEPVTREMMEAGGGIEEYGHRIKTRLDSRVGTELAGMEILENGFRLNRPTLWYRLGFDTDAFIEDMVDRVNRETGGTYSTAQAVMAYVLVFEREDQLSKYLGRRAGAALCTSEPERSAIDLGYRFSLIFHPLEPDTVVFPGEAREETTVVDRIGRYNHSDDSCEELDFGIVDAEKTLDEYVAAMVESLESGAAQARYDIVDYPEDAFWKKRTLALIKQMK